MCTPDSKCIHWQHMYIWDHIHKVGACACLGAYALSAVHTHANKLRSLWHTSNAREQIHALLAAYMYKQPMV